MERLRRGVKKMSDFKWGSSSDREREEKAIKGKNLFVIFPELTLGGINAPTEFYRNYLLSTELVCLGAEFSLLPVLLFRSGISFSESQAKTLPVCIHICQIFRVGL